jgi:nitric oxide reductase subunit B
MQWTVWLRIPGDIVFTLGAIGMVLFTVRAVYSLFQQPTLREQPQPVTSIVERI